MLSFENRVMGLLRAITAVVQKNWTILWTKFKQTMARGPNTAQKFLSMPLEGSRHQKYRIIFESLGLFCKFNPALYIQPILNQHVSILKLIMKSHWWKYHNISKYQYYFSTLMIVDCLLEAGIIRRTAAIVLLNGLRSVNKLINLNEIIDTTTPAGAILIGSCPRQCQF